MRLEERIEGEVAILSLNGDLLDENDGLEVEQKLHSLLVDGIKKIVFDVRSLHQVNENGLETLMNAIRTIRGKGGDIRLARVDSQIDNIFVKTRLVRIFRTYETVGRALASFIV